MPRDPDADRARPRRAPDDPGPDPVGPSTQASAGHVAQPVTPVSTVSEAPSRLETERYTEQEVIGQGGSSVVIRALDNDILRHVAIKILGADLTNDSPLVDRFAEEARITGQLEHPSIVPVYELGIDRGGRRFLAMKLIEGKNLEETLGALGEARLEPANLAELLQVFVKVCDAVSFAHSRGVIHRDLKPRNVMMSDFGQVYVLDWGIARLLPQDASSVRQRIRVTPRSGKYELDPPGSFFGTAGYVPPEQLHGLHDKLDEQTDVFALGATLYEMLAGQPPLSPGMQVVWARRGTPAITPPERLVPNGQVPAELSRIALRALSYDRSQRYGSVLELKRDIESFQRGSWDLPRLPLPAGTVILREGESGDAAYVILEGRCLAYRQEDGEEVELRDMGAGEVFGETAVFSHKPRSASVKALTPVVLLQVTSAVLSRALGLNSWMGAFVRALADRFREADQRLRDVERGGGGSGVTPISTRTAYYYQDSGERAVAPPMSDDAFSRAAADLPRVKIPAGSIIASEGEVARVGYVVLQGSCVESRAEEAELRHLGVGDVIGETSVLSDKPSLVTVKASTSVELLVVDRELMSNALGLDSWMGTFVHALANRLRQLDGRMREGRRRAQ